MTTTLSTNQDALGAKDEIADYGPLPTASELIYPLLEPLLLIFDVGSRATVLVELLERSEFVEVTDEEWAAGSDLLALMHRVADLLAAELDSWVVPGSPSPAGAIRQGLNLALGTERLAQAVVDIERRRLHNASWRTVEGVAARMAAEALT